jgi:hypothetical protein
MLAFDYNKASQWHMIMSRDNITPVRFPQFDLPYPQPDDEDTKVLHESAHYFNRVLPE